MHISSGIKRFFAHRPIFYPTHVLIVFVILTGSFSLFSVSLQHVLAKGVTKTTGTAGTSVVVQIHGPMQPPGFSPALLTIHLYDTVIFVNQTTTAYAVATDDNSFSSPAIAPHRQWETTFGILGTHSYHATTTTSSTSMIGEVLVVADTVSLLPTPQPQIEATALSIIQAGKHPPDVIQLSTTSTASVPHHSSRTITGWPTLIPILPFFVGVGGIVVFCIVTFGITRSRRKHRTVSDDEFEDEVFALYNSVVDQSPQGKDARAATLTATKEVKVRSSLPRQTLQHSKPSLLQTIRTRLRRHQKDEENTCDEEGDEDEE